MQWWEVPQRGSGRTPACAESTEDFQESQIMTALNICTSSIFASRPLHTSWATKTKNKQKNPHQTNKKNTDHKKYPSYFKKFMRSIVSKKFFEVYFSPLWAQWPQSNQELECPWYWEPSARTHSDSGFKGREWGKINGDILVTLFHGLKSSPHSLEDILFPHIPKMGEMAMIRNQISIVSIPGFFFFLLDISFLLLTPVSIKSNNSLGSSYQWVEVEAYICADLYVYWGQECYPMDFISF